MLNYIKSECYRISHRPALYVTTLLLSVFVVGLIMLIAMFAWDTDNASAVSAGVTYAGLISSPQVFMYMAATFTAVSTNTAMSRTPSPAVFPAYRSLLANALPA